MSVEKCYIRDEYPSPEILTGPQQRPRCHFATSESVLRDQMSLTVNTAACCLGNARENDLIFAEVPLVWGGTGRENEALDGCLFQVCVDGRRGGDVNTLGRGYNGDRFIDMTNLGWQPKQLELLPLILHVSSFYPHWMGGS